MQIKRVFKRGDKTWEVDAEFTDNEMQVVIDVGLNTLFETGAIPFVVEEDNRFIIQPPSSLQ